jgi:hypothetical protein
MDDNLTGACQFNVLDWYPFFALVSDILNSFSRCACAEIVAENCAAPNALAGYI